jgi:hypothetical protein
LKLDGHGYSATILHRILHMAGVVSSFDVAAVALAVVGEIQISDREINKLAVEVGGQLQADRDARTAAYVNQDLPRPSTEVTPPVDLAGVFCDGGRMRTREEGQGTGVHRPHWREPKNAAFHRMQSGTFAQDPQPDLSACFRNQAYVEKLVKGLKGHKKEGREEVVEKTPSPTEVAEPLPERCEWQPKTLFRTCLSSLATSDDFGPMMAAEADARGFFAAQKKAFLGDGLPYNWTIQQRWFPRFEPIVDFLHAVEYLYTCAKAVHAVPTAYWQQYVDWATACWQGRVDQVLIELNAWQARVGSVPEGEELSESDPRKVIQTTRTYLTNNPARMDYPRYRKEGLPVTSSLAESLVKQIHQRVKGTEKFWNDGVSGEAILQIRAAIISEDERLATWLRTRPISPFSPRCRSATLTSSITLAVSP